MSEGRLGAGLRAAGFDTSSNGFETATLCRNCRFSPISKRPFLPALRERPPRIVVKNVAEASSGFNKDQQASFLSC